MSARDRAGVDAVAVPPGSRSVNAGRGRRLFRFALAFFTVIVVVDAVVGENGVLALVEKRRQFAKAERALEQSREDNRRMRETARRLREDRDTIEAVARRDLGLIKPGEKVFIVKDALPRR